ncbi:MAG TPA: FAD-dependent oxidoreductase [Dehalococcoidia bacterium]|nr:FAD-dependent oxidoreductase [Dehalococcoidia bacterium]
MAGQTNSGSETVTEPARSVPVYRRCNVLVIGGGPAGSAAAASAARMGADTVLMERYGHLGGMSTGGFCLWIDRMSDFEGQQVISGFASDVLDRMPKEALLGPSSDLWGSRDPELVDYWRQRAAAFHGVVTWSPTIDSEMLKIAHQNEVLDRGATLLLHAWGVATIQEGNEVRGVIFESKSGRQAILADVVIDTTGDGDIFAMAGASWDSDIIEDDIHHQMNVAFLWGGVDMERYLQFRDDHREEYQSIMERARRENVVDRPHVMPRNDQALFMGPRLSGLSSLSVDDLTVAEVESRRRMQEMIGFYKGNMPGFEGAFVSATAPQMGTRHSRRLTGVERMTADEWKAGTIFDDEIGISPPPTPRFANVSMPYGSLVPEQVENLLAAGRLLSCDAQTHTFMREVPNCWAMGQAAGVAAALSISGRVRVRDVDVTDLQRELTRQGVPLHSNGATTVSPVGSDEGSEVFRSAWEQARATGVADPDPD